MHELTYVADNISESSSSSSAIFIHMNIHVREKTQHRIATYSRFHPIPVQHACECTINASQSDVPSFNLRHKQDVSEKVFYSPEQFHRARQLYKNSSMLFLFLVKDGKLSTGVNATFDASCYGLSSTI